MEWARGWGWISGPAWYPQNANLLGDTLNRHSTTFKPELPKTESEVAKAGGNVLSPPFCFVLFFSSHLVLTKCSIFFLPGNKRVSQNKNLDFSV